MNPHKSRTVAAILAAAVAVVVVPVAAHADPTQTPLPSCVLSANPDLEKGYPLYFQCAAYTAPDGTRINAINLPDDLL